MRLSRTLRERRTRGFAIATLSFGLIALCGTGAVTVLIPLVLRTADVGTWPDAATALVVVGAVGTAVCSSLLQRRAHPKGQSEESP